MDSINSIVRQALEVFDESEAWSAWAEGWLSGRDMSAESANQASTAAKAIADMYDNLPRPRSAEDMDKHDAAIAATYAAKAACQYARFASREFRGEADPALYTLRAVTALRRIGGWRNQLDEMKQMLEEILRRLELVERRIQLFERS